VDPDNSCLSTDGRCVFSADGTELYAALGSIQTYQVPFGVKTISRGAFAELPSLTDIVFSDTLETIEENAFEHTNLRSVHLGPGVRSIESSAFAYCEKLGSAVFENGIEHIGKYAFYGCPLASVSLPASVRSLGANCFPCFSEYDDSMRDFRIAENNPWLNADGSALYQMDGKDKTLSAFYGHTYRQHVYDWSNISDFPSYVVADGTTVIGEGAFRGSQNLGEVVLPYGLKRIEDSAFENCSNLSVVDIPETVTYIGANAFCGCNISAVNIPEGVQRIGEGAFSMGWDWGDDYSPLRQISVSPENRCFFVNDNCLFRNTDAPELIAYFGGDDRVAVLENTSKIDSRAFCRARVSEVSIPATVQSIGEKAFHRCLSLKRLIIGMAVPENGISEATVYIPEASANNFGIYGVSDRDQFLDCVRVDGSGCLFDFVKYDGLFDTITSPKSKVLVATDRLKSAIGLIPHYRDRYLAYLRENAWFAVEIVIKYDDLKGLDTLAKLGVFTTNNIQKVIELANVAVKTDVLGYLMNYQNTEIGFADDEWDL